MFHRPTGVKPKPWMGALGFLGFAGLLGFMLNYSPFLLFFAFFGFFSFYWWSKVDYNQPDERLVDNQLRAVAIAYRLSVGVTILGVILVIRYFTTNPSLGLSLLITTISLSWALSGVVEAYLTYRYEQAGE